MKHRGIRLMVLLLLPLLLASCHVAPPATLTPLATGTDTATAVNFLEAARQLSSGNLTCNRSVFTPDLGISEADFLGVSVYGPSGNVTGARFRGQPYECRAFSQAFGYLRGTVELSGRLIAFDDPQPGVTRTGGGIATVTKVYQDGSVAGTDEYYDQTLNFYGHSMGVIYREAGDVKILDIYYKPDCSGSQPHLTLVLAPVPNSPPPP